MKTCNAVELYERGKTSVAKVAGELYRGGQAGVESGSSVTALAGVLNITFIGSARWKLQTGGPPAAWTLASGALALRCHVGPSKAPVRHCPPACLSRFSQWSGPPLTFAHQAVPNGGHQMQVGTKQRSGVNGGKNASLSSPASVDEADRVHPGVT